ncbi:cupin domain-containing protein [Streptomyces triticagri]|uniref:Cupin domain-containing protein n=1 Tax=Streptomyces triticagri TaxID=2293568 RepID=A0A372M5W4_9ACTN|nr:cupin domain-containing protein [Streptomyces triticagri]RFU85935.1 cupin domain-containing protein [Streptomyces triticagri]
MSAERPETARLLGLEPHPEGGWYRETWRSDVVVRPEGYPGTRPSATAIHFLLAPGEQSRWHTVRSAELWLWHSGGPLHLELGGSGEAPGDGPSRVVLGPDLVRGQVVQAVVPPGVWQRAEPARDEEVLVSCIVSPGFSFEDFRLLEE